MDTVYAAGGYSNWENRSNVIYAGDDQDSIVASSGDDTFIFERGNGFDFIQDSGGIDTIVMGPSVAAEDVLCQVVVRYNNDGYGGQIADLWIGIRDPNNPNLTASQVADRIQIWEGATIYFDLDTSQTRFNSVEHIRVGGQEIDLSKAGLNFVYSFYHSYGGYEDGGNGGEIPPIAIDLDGDGIELRSVEGSRISTVDADGNLWRLGWVGSDDGLLALDRDGNGAIDRIAEIAFMSDLEGAKSDLEGLAAYDSNADGLLDAKDERWSEFKVWRDKNQDGLGIGKELMTLAEAGIVSISLAGQKTGFTPADGIDNTVLATTTIGWADPSRTGLGYDVALAVHQVRSDGGGREAAEKIKGQDKMDEVDAKLFGIQTMSEAEVAAAKAREGGRPGIGEGYLGRVETFLAGAVRSETGLLRAADADAAHARNVKDAREADADAGQDKFAGSEWSREGSRGNDKNSGHAGHLPLPRPDGAPSEDLPSDLEAVAGDGSVRGWRTREAGLGTAVPSGPGLEAAIAFFDEQRRLAAADEAARTARDAADRERPPVTIRPPSAEEMALRERNDPFRFLDGPDRNQWEPSSVTRLDERSFRQPDAPRALSIDERDADLLPAHIAGNPGADYTQAAGNTRPLALASASALLATGELNVMGRPEEAHYARRVKLANARLIQALGTFGKRASMMASYGSLVDPAADPRSAWLTVNHRASVQNLAQIV